MNIDWVNTKIKQRPPFQMIEKVLEYEAGESAVGIKNVSVNEPYFVGHFPDAPIMPGVLIIEACAQLCSIVMTSGDVNDDDKVLYVLLKVDGFKFVKPVIPGDTLKISVKKTRAGGPLVAFDATVTVGDTLCAKGSMTFTVTDKAGIYADK
ncbi:MAG: 3-hydroxyacyl-ACP dehydratase FabZ [Clostridiales bacterium]|nr:3-hydroxyacyl-ACP dehydratase FabZ [Clostridiales bacterium]